MESQQCRRTSRQEDSSRTRPADSEPPSPDLSASQTATYKEHVLFSENKTSGGEKGRERK